MGPRVLLLIGLVAACGRDAPRSGAAWDSAPPTRPPVPAVLADAGDLAPDAEVIRPTDVLTGTAAEQAIASGKTHDPSIAREDPGAAPPTPPLPYLVTTDGVGPFRLGNARADVVRALGRRGALDVVARGPTAPTQEVATLSEAAGPLLRLRVLAGRLVEVDVLARDRRAATVSGLQVGSTFQEAIDAHGDPRRVDDERTRRPRGFVLADLPGVIIVPADPALLGREAPPGHATIGQLRVVGPEETSAPD